MRVELTEMLWLDQQELSLAELARLSRLEEALLHELGECGVITPLEPGAQSSAGSQPRFGAAALATARAAYRLREDFELDTSGLVLALRLLDRIGELEQQLRGLQARMPGR